MQNGNNTEKNIFSGKARDEYEILSCIKKGGDSAVYLAYDIACGRKCVIKQGKSDVIENEARLLAKISCGGVPEVYRCFEDGGKTYLVKSFVKGSTLREQIEKNGAFDEKTARSLCVKVCGILEELHGSEPPVIHRDIKPENIILSDDGSIHIIDFGTAREYDPVSPRDTVVMGTPSFAPPEQFGFGQTDERSDIYTVGVLLRELMTGTPDVRKGDIPPETARIINKCTAFSPDERYKSVSDIRKELQGSHALRSAVKKAVQAAAACIALMLAFAAGAAFSSAQRGMDTEDGAVTESASIFAETEASAKAVTEEENKPQEYIFRDKAIEAEVRRVIGKETDPLTKEDLESVTEISLVGETGGIKWEDLIIHGKQLDVRLSNEIREFASVGEVESVEDLPFMPNLSTVILCNQNISDISPLSGMNIRRLALHNNSISDISGLEKCVRLERLYISYNPVSDLSPVTNIKRLYCIDVGATEISSFDDIAAIPKLTMLSVHDCRNISDYSSFGKINGLEFISMRPVPDEAFRHILEMTSLSSLYIWEAKSFKRLDSLNSLTKLKYVFADYCDLESISGFKGMGSLTALSVESDNITDISPLSEAVQLRTLDITKISASDFSVLSGLPALETLTCSEEQYEAVSAALENNENVNIIIN